MSDELKLGQPVRVTVTGEVQGLERDRNGKVTRVRIAVPNPLNEGAPQYVWVDGDAVAIERSRDEIDAPSWVHGETDEGPLADIPEGYEDEELGGEG